MRGSDSPVPTCPTARLFEACVDEIVKKLTADTPQEAYPAIIDSITRLKERFAPKVASSLHFGSLATGTTHFCLQDSFAIAVTYLESMKALAPIPAPQEPPPARLMPRSLSDVVKDFAGMPEAASEAATTDNGK